MTIAPIHIESYLTIHYPNVAKEVLQKLFSVECNIELIRNVNDKSTTLFHELWESQMITISAVLLLCSPETIHANSKVRNGVAISMSRVLGISRQAVCQKVDRSRHYYQHVSWCRDSVDKIVKEVRGE